MRKRLLYQFSGRLPLRVISDDGKPYLERYYLGTFAGVRWYLHRFVRSDPDRGLHDHPWPWAGSVLLFGHYREQLPERVRLVRYFNWLWGSTFHRVLLPATVSEVWTLFFHRAYNSKSWGFRTQEGQTLRNASGENLREWWRIAPRGDQHGQRQPPR
jgi:hypothetical protein